jgi:predicted GNAT superfamily acetyltransferase
VEIRRLDTARDAAAAAALFAEVWQHEQMTPNLLRALDHAGGYVYGAFEGGDLVAAAAAFLGREDGALRLHSHILGVRAGARGGGLGEALKRHQRDWAREQGIPVVAWTFDPLVRRNAYFNVAKLGAPPARYLVDFYGPMADGINRGDETDRLLVEWPTSGDPPPPPAEPPVPVLRDDGGAPVAADAGGARWVSVAVPDDVERLRPSDPALARRWRHAVRDVLGGALDGGARVVGFGAAGYVLDWTP